MTALPASLSFRIASEIPGASASTTETATPLTSEAAKASSSRRICLSVLPSLSPLHLDVGRELLRRHPSSPSRRPTTSRTLPLVTSTIRGPPPRAWHRRRPWRSVVPLGSRRSAELPPHPARLRAARVPPPGPNANLELAPCSFDPRAATPARLGVQRFRIRWMHDDVRPGRAADASPHRSYRARAPEGNGPDLDRSRMNPGCLATACTTALAIEGSPDRSSMDAGRWAITQLGAGADGG